jgi:hypothetical protein
LIRIFSSGIQGEIFSNYNKKKELLSHAISKKGPREQNEKHSQEKNKYCEEEISYLEEERKLRS